MLLFSLPLYSIRFSHPNTRQDKETISLEKNCREFLYLSTQSTFPRQHVKQVGKWARKARWRMST